MKHIHIDQYTAIFNAFLKEHGEHKETCDKSDWGDTYKEIYFSDGATWNECRRADGTLEFWNSKDSQSRMVDEGAENEWLSLGGGFTIPLNEKYSKSFTLANFYLTKNGKYMKVKLQSNWNSSYNETRFHNVENCGGTPMNVIAEYTR